MGRVDDEGGEPVAGATVVAENPEALPGRVETTTQENGNFTVRGLRAGNWTLTVMAPGFLPFQTQTRATSKGGIPLVIKMAKGASAGMFDGISDEVKEELSAASAFYDKQQYSEALAAYESLQQKLPDLTTISLQVANVHRQMKNYDQAIAVYDEVLAKEPNNHGAKQDRAMTYLAKGDIDTADTALTEVAQSLDATAETFYNLGEVKFARGEVDLASTWYERAVSANSAWGKPLFKLGLVALNKGDIDGARGYMQKVIDVDPSSVEAAQAALILEQL
jgi:tetratricopeptide (TPR) repeat protein